MNTLHPHYIPWYAPKKPPYFLGYIPMLDTLKFPYYVCVYIYIFNFWCLNHHFSQSLMVNCQCFTIIPASSPAKGPQLWCKTSRDPTPLRLPGSRSGYPNSWNVYDGNSKHKMDDLGVPKFLETSIYIYMYVLSECIWDKFYLGKNLSWSLGVYIYINIYIHT